LSPLQSINVVDVATTTDPTNTNAYGARFPLPEFPLGIALASGVAFIADGSADLLVIGYHAAAAAGSPPTTAISSLTAAANTGSPGTQVVASTPIHLQATANDDTAVRSVEFLVNGQVVATDSSFPYESLIPAGDAGTTLTVQARAVDITGLATLSDV